MSFWTAGLCGITVCFSGSLAANVGHAQDLAPRAYVITPIHSNAITLTYSFFDGSLVFEGTIPITGAQARVNVTIFNYSHSLRSEEHTSELQSQSNLVCRLLLEK